MRSYRSIRLEGKHTLCFNVPRGKVLRPASQSKPLQGTSADSATMKSMIEHQKRALVTGGAGLIGSHIVDLLLSEGWTVRILDNLEPQTHKNGKPEWVNPQAEFRQG